jgi:hypothetical protein
VSEKAIKINEHGMKTEPQWLCSTALQLHLVQPPPRLPVSEMAMKIHPSMNTAASACWYVIMPVP